MTTRLVSRGFRAVSLSLLCGLSATLGAQQTRHEIIRGRITTDSGRVVAGAMVVAQRAPDRAVKSAQTDAAGLYTIDWPDGTGDYLVTVRAAGFPIVTRRISRAGADSVLVFDALVTNRPRVQQLPATVTQAQRPAPTRNDDPEIGGTSAIAPSYRRIGPDLVGDLTALTALVPGVISTPAGNSVLGLSPSQNTVTMNGMAFGGAQIPRDVRTRVNVSASSYDPANGWFSGARTNVYVASSELFSLATVHLTGDAPSLQATDPVAAHLGQRYTNVNGSLGMSGEILDDRFDYNFGLQGGRRTADVSSLLDASGDLLRHAGVASDSVSRLLQLLQSAHVPTVPAGRAFNSSINDNVVFLGRIDHARYDWQTLKPSRATWGLIGYGSYDNNEARGISPTSTPAHAGTTAQAIGALTGEYSFYFNKDWLGDVRSGVTLRHNSSTPYLQLPDGRVLVTSALDDGTTGVTPLAFGGNSSMHSDTRQVTWESLAELQLFPGSFARHRVKLSADSRLDTYRQDLTGNQLGAFAFNSLADLASNTPASFTRTLNAPIRTGGEWNGYAALGDLWRASQNLQLMYGARIEGSAFTSAPAHNAAVESAFGVRTDAAPSALHVSPRFGFTLNRPGGAGKPSGSLRGGVGEFRNLLDPTLLAAPSVATGLPGGLTRVTCIGSAVPSPDWSSYENSIGSIPTNCLGAPVATYSDAAPNVQLVSPSFRPQRSWRGNLAWTSSLWGRTVYSIEGLSSLNLDQPSAIDLNFSGAERFVTSDEGRPVFANATSIVPSTGAVSSVDARKSIAFGRVSSGVSDLRSYTNQLRLSFRPDLGPGGRYFRDPTVWYVLSDTRAQLRGFSGSTFGDPATRAWSRGDLDVRHQFTLQTVVWPRGFKPGPGIFFYGHLQSGLPFTPMVASDVNGDGLANDRAFIFDPSRTGDAAMANGIRQLQASGSKNARDCIAGQLGHAAGPNSCHGPWTASLNMNVVLEGAIVSHRFERFQFGLNLTNPLGGLDQLVHGANNLKGWGTQAQPDPVLYNVRGFDPTTSRFKYEVNPRFGSTNPSSNTIRAPFRLTLDVTMDVARPMVDQQLDRWLRPGRGGRATPKLTRDQLLQRLQRNVPDPYGELLQQTDSLLLTATQVTSVQGARTRYRARIDSLWTGLAQYLFDLPDRYAFDEVSKQMDAVVDRAWELSRIDVRTTYREILAPEQLAILPGWSSRLFNAERPLHIRLFVQ